LRSCRPCAQEAVPQCGNWRVVERIATAFTQQEERVSIAYRRAITDATAVPA
jgi:hypothetical protein